MATKKEKTGLLGRTEFVIGAILILLIFIWQVPFCNKKSPEVERPTVERKSSKKSKLPTIYITIDSLNMRSAPHLDSVIVAKLPVGSSVIYLEERTNFRQRINLNGVAHNEPWVKVRTPEDKEGWIYAEGARFYPPDR